ncbi:MAG: T9SS type A sorting domain-containing protein, partial [Bacteroidia bacterium]
YSLVITQNGCTSEPGTSQATVYTLPPKYTLSKSGTTEFCSGLGVTLSVPANQFFSYRWYKNNAVINGAQSNSYYATTSGDYYVMLTSVLSYCSNNSFVTTVTVYGCRAGDPAPDKVVEELVLYPNPSSGEVILEIPFDEMNPTSKILIYDATGKLVADETKSNSEVVKLDLSLLNNGIYFVRVITGEVTAEKKIIINK